MILRVVALIFALALSLLFFHRTYAQDINSFKPGVVRIENSRMNEVGTGFIIKIDGINVYIVTAAHVVRGEQHPSVYLFSQQHKPVSATLLNRESDDNEGLALILVETNAKTLSGLIALKMGFTSDLGNGENVKIIGFPGSTSLWTVDNGSVKRLEGRNLVLSGAIREGDSGGPVILNEQAIGLVTDVNQSDVYAARAEIIVTYVNGIVRNLIATSDPPSRKNEPQNEPNEDLCGILAKLIAASKNGFDSIVGNPTSSENYFIPNVKIPGASSSVVYPPSMASYYLLTDSDKGKVESQFYITISKIRMCLPKWKEKEKKGSLHRYHIFEEKGSKIEVYYNLKTDNDYYYLQLSILAPEYDIEHK